MYDHNTQTQFAENQILKIDPIEDIDILSDAEYAKTLEENKFVLNGVVKRLKELGYDVHQEDTKNIRDILKSRYKEKGIDYESQRKNIDNWISKNKVRTDQPYRKNLYKLCTALDMDIDQTTEFFLKNFLTIPFVFKDRIDAIFYFGIKNGLKYPEIEALIKEAEEFEECEENKNTQFVKGSLDNIIDKDLLLEFLKENTFSEKQKFSRARCEIEKLLNEAVELAENEKSENPEDGVKTHELRKTDGTVNYNGLLSVIYGMNYQNSENNLNDQEHLPKTFRKDFPLVMQFNAIKKNTATAEVYRKALIVLKYYCFFRYVDKNRNTGEIQEDYLDFYDETSELLYNCGFEQMYLRNPFDWLILRSAYSSNPVDSFREILAGNLED